MKKVVSLILLLLCVQTLVFAGNNDVILNLKNNKYHKPECEYAQNIRNSKTIKKPLLNIKYKPSSCCHVNNKEQEEDISKLAAFKNESIEVHFLSPLVDYQKKPNGALLRLKNLILTAQKRIYFAIYGISCWDIINALINKYNARLDVKWVTDINKYGKYNYSRTAFLQEKIPNFKTDWNDEILKLNNKQAVDFYIKEQKISAEFSDEEIGYFTDQLMHNKFFVIDNNIVTTGSANISTVGIGGQNTNANDFLVIKSEKINELFAQEFLQMYSGKFHRDKKIIPNKKNIKLDDETIISVYFAPTDNDFLKDIITIINNSKNYIYVPMFYLTEPNVTQALIQAKERGVDVKVILDASSALSKYSKHKILRLAGIPVKVENWVGKMHMKALITERYVVTGSLNWTNRAQYFNDENSLIIDNPKIAETYKKTFITLYNSIPDKWLNADPKPEGPDTPGSCSDGMDNDHDGFVDMDDLDCNPNAKQGKPHSDYYEKQN